jgi:hypothetical protein
LPVRAEVVVVAVEPDLPLRDRRLAPRAIRRQEDADFPACSEGIARTNLPLCYRCALIAAADFRKGRDGAGLLVPAEDE